MSNAPDLLLLTVVYYDRSTSNKHTHLPTHNMHTHKRASRGLILILWSMCYEGLRWCHKKNSWHSRIIQTFHGTGFAPMRGSPPKWKMPPWQSLPIVSLFNQRSSVALNIPMVHIHALENAALCPARCWNASSHRTVYPHWSVMMMTGEYLSAGASVVRSFSELNWPF